jgi:hypothetical protein
MGKRKTHQGSKQSSIDFREKTYKLGKMDPILEGRGTG